MKYILPLDRPVKSKMVILTTAGAGKNFLMWLILGWKRKPAEENEQYQKEGPHFFDNKEDSLEAAKKSGLQPLLNKLNENTNLKNWLETRPKSNF